MAIKSVKHLAVVITPSLSWSEHVRSLISHMGHRLFILKRLAYRCFSSQFVSRLYLSLIRPALECASVAFDSWTKADATRLERVQLSVGRAVLRCSRRSVSNKSVLFSLNWPTLAWRRRRVKLLLLFKLLSGEGPPALQGALPCTTAGRAGYSFRSAHSLQFPVCNSSSCLRSFISSAIALWNQLPQLVVSATSSPSFLSRLDAHFAADKFSLGLP